ncbi:MAG TPA: hypothetical protein VE031_13495 [Chthoniobacterales bacterium]|nr:hypothetical protein [Chthoniobacterales bacterium]
MTRTYTRNGGLSSLSEPEKQTVFECLRAASDGPFFPDWEFHTLFGLERDQVRRIAAAIPHIDDSSKEVALAINNAMAHLTGYPRHQEAVWSQFISVPEEEVDRVFTKWRGDAVI